MEQVPKFLSKTKVAKYIVFKMFYITGQVTFSGTSIHFEDPQCTTVLFFRHIPTYLNYVK